MKICIIGSGRWGKNHIKTAFNLGVLSAVIDTNPDTELFIKENYPSVAFYNSIHDEGALRYDAYSVVVPAEYHFDIAKKLLQEKKHVLVEKPITLNSKDAR